MNKLHYIYNNPSTPPSHINININNSLTTTFTYINTLTTLHHKNMTNEDQIINSTIYKTMLNIIKSLITKYDKNNYIQKHTNTILPNVTPSNIYPTKNKQYILITTNQNTIFKHLTKTIQQPKLTTNKHYTTHTAHSSVQQKLNNLIAE